MQKFRPRTTYDLPAVKTARKNETEALETLQTIESDPNAGEFLKHKSEQDLLRARTGKGLFDKSLFQKVQFLALEKSEAERKSLLNISTASTNSQAPDPLLYVPSLNCNANVYNDSNSSPTTPNTKSTATTTERGELVPAEVRVNDKILLQINNIHNNSSRNSNNFGAGLNIDTPVLLQSRAEKCFFNNKLDKNKMKETKNLHEQTRKEQKNKKI